MIAVIFELTPAPGRTQEYFDLAAGLAGELKDIDGFVSIERFESVSSLRVAQVRDYTMDERGSAPGDSVSFHAQVRG